jgi:Flp pilus assembly protein TadG
MRREGERGAVAVELALILPIFLLFVYGGITFGMVLSLKQLVTQGASEGPARRSGRR